MMSDGPSSGAGEFCQFLNFDGRTFFFYVRSNFFYLNFEFLY